MKKLLLLSLILLLTFSFMTLLLADEDTTWTEEKTIQYKGGSKNIDVLWTNLNNKRIVIEAGIPSSGLGTVDSLGNIVNAQSNSDGIALGGINGTFFDAYDDFDVQGTIIEEGLVRHIINSGSTISFTGDNQVSVDQLNISIDGGINRLWSWPNTWYATSINFFSTNETAIMLFDSEYGALLPSHDFTGILVNNKIITAINVGLKTIPSEGYLILLKDQTILNRFHIGDEIDYRVTYRDRKTGNEISGFNQTMTALGAGPTLVKNGQIVVDASGEGFNADKITTTKATRSICGVTKDNLLAMFVVSNVTINEAAEIAKNLGLISAINLDGGASAGIYYNGKYLNTPGRLISNGLIIRELKEEPINIVINNKPIYFDALPYLNTTYNRNLVPLRKIAESLESTVSWESKTNSILITRFGVELKLQSNSTTVYVNGLAHEMDIPVTIKNQRSYVPIRFITEYFGGDVTWNGNTRTVSINMSNNNDQMKQAQAFIDAKAYSQAIDMYLNVYNLDKSRIDVLKLITEIYRLNLKDSANAKIYCKMILDKSPDDPFALKTYGWIVFGEKDFATCIDTMNHLIEVSPEDSNSYYALGLIYSNWRYEDKQKAKEYFTICLTKNPQDYMIEYINSL